jgi:type III secretion system YscQ/HrcQ family protein
VGRVLTRGGPSPSVRPFPFATLSRLQRAQVVAGRFWRARLPLAPGAQLAALEAALGGAIRVEVTEVSLVPLAELAERTHGTWVRLWAPLQRSIFIGIDPRLAVASCRHLLGLGQSGELEAPRALTLAERGALELLIVMLTDGLGVQIAGVLDERVSFARPGAPPEPLWCVLEATVSTPLGDGWARLIAPDSLRSTVWPPRAGGLFDRLAAMRCELVVEVSRTRVRTVDLSALALGDVLVFEGSPAGSDLVLLRLGRGAFSARLSGEKLEISDRFRGQLGGNMERDRTQEASPGAADGGATDALLRELSVEVACEVGRVQMSAREVCELQPGAVLPVGRPLRGPVDLTVGGRLIGRGELVDVEGELGVRVTELATAPSAR